MAARAARITIVPESAQRRRLPHPPENQRSNAPAAWDKLAHSRSATPPGARQRLHRDAEIVGDKVSWRPSMIGGLRDGRSLALRGLSANVGREITWMLLCLHNAIF